jgi:hypothetical protein
MLTHKVRRKLAQQYGIRDIPAELLDYFVSQRRQQLAPGTVAPAATIAFLIANAWQHGLHKAAG